MNFNRRNFLKTLGGAIAGAMIITALPSQKPPRVCFDRIITPNFSKDIEELRKYDYDIREIFKENAIKDMMAEEDAKFFQLVERFEAEPVSFGIWERLRRAFQFS